MIFLILLLSKDLFEIFFLFILSVDDFGPLGLFMLECFIIYFGLMVDGIYFKQGKIGMVFLRI